MFSYPITEFFKWVYYKYEYFAISYLQNIHVWSLLKAAKQRNSQRGCLAVARHLAMQIQR